MFISLSYIGLLLFLIVHHAQAVEQQAPLLQYAENVRTVSPALLTELEELARIVDISYCVGVSGLGIAKPFKCLSRCKDFPEFDLVTTWNTGPLLSDSCGFIALDHTKKRVLVAFRGTYSITNTVIDLSTIPQEYVPYPGSEENSSDTSSIKSLFKTTGRLLPCGNEPVCTNCTVHVGFHTSWLHTRTVILPYIEEQMLLYPSYQLNLVGHSLGGAVACLAGLDFHARGLRPTVTTFGEPRIGNADFARFLEKRFDIRSEVPSNDIELLYRRVTHINDPVPLLPLTEWGYAMHAGEIYISKPSLSPDISDVYHCIGASDSRCIASQDTTLPANLADGLPKRDLLASAEHEIHDIAYEPWGVPSRYRLWELFFAHRDYFWRLGLCVPGGDPFGGGRKHENVMETR